MSTATLPESRVTPVESAASLKPKEHGAYAILGIPIVSSLIVTGPTIVGLCVACASVAGFLAHEPLLVAIGHRGGRAQRGTPGAWKRLTILLLLSVACGSLALTLGSPRVRLSLMACGMLAVVSFTLALIGKHKTVFGQLLGVSGLSVPCVPILLAGNIAPPIAWQAWGTWVLGFAATTMAVRGVITAQKRASRALHWWSLSMLTVAVAILFLAGYSLPLVTLPMLAMSWYLMLQPPPAKQLRRVGWTLVAGTVASALWMVGCILTIAA